MSNTNWMALAGKRTLRVVGLMSGTSADGIDAALVEITGKSAELKAFRTYPYPKEVRRAVLEMCAGKADTPRICHMNALLGELFAEAVIKLARSARVKLNQIDLIGSHGQTICHLPSPRREGGKTVRSTLQIAEPSIIAERTGITAIADFRPRDMAAGGQARPWCPTRISCCSRIKRRPACCATSAASPTSRICLRLQRSAMCWPWTRARAIW